MYDCQDIKGSKLLNKNKIFHFRKITASILCVLLCAIAIWCKGQASDSIFTEKSMIEESTELPLWKRSYTDEPLTLKPFDRKVWLREKEGMDFSEDMMRKEKKSVKPAQKKQPWSFLQPYSKILKILVVLLGIGLLVYLILKITGGDALFARKDKSIRPGSLHWQIETMSDRLMESELEGLTSKAIENEDFPLAIRIYYLMTIKALAQRNLLRWQPDKTNRDYLLELRRHPIRPLFGEVTLIYERIWYGDKALKKREFDDIQPAFLQLLARIDQL